MPSFVLGSMIGQVSASLQRFRVASRAERQTRSQPVQWAGLGCWSVLGWGLMGNYSP